MVASAVTTIERKKAVVWILAVAAAVMVEKKEPAKAMNIEGEEENEEKGCR